MKNLLIQNDLSSDEISSLKQCLNAFTKQFEKNETIMDINQSDDLLGIITKGTAYLVSISPDGEKNIIDYYCDCNFFGKKLSPDSDINAYFITAKSSCTVTFMEYSRIIYCCQNCCEKHKKLIDYMISNSIRRSQIHIDILSQRTIRDKLTYYFKLISKEKDSKQIKIPIPLSDLADYLSSDRSAMMREIKKMNEEGIIRSKGRRIFLAKIK